jgi:hypothetical protein
MMMASHAVWRAEPQHPRKSAAVHVDICTFWIGTYHPPFAEQHLVEKAVQRMASTLPNENDRDLLKEMLDQGLERATRRLQEYAQFDPDQFNLQEVNARLSKFMPYGRAHL